MTLMINKSNLLTDWGMNIINSPEACNNNIGHLLDLALEFDEGVTLIGRGKSGSNILSMYQLLRHILGDKPKSVVQVCEFNLMELPNQPIIIVDDHIYTGRTLKEIKSFMYPKDINNVEVIFAIGANNHQDLIRELFPNVSLIIH